MYKIIEWTSTYFWITRPLNSSTAAFAVIFALLFSQSLSSTSIPVFVLIFAGCAAYFTTAHAMVHNDIVDIEIDKINAPDRPLPSGRLSVKAAKIWAGILLSLAIISGLIIDQITMIYFYSTLWAIGNALLLDFYNLRLKKYGIIGNFIVGFSPYALFLYSDILVNRTLTLPMETIGLFTLFVIWGREVFKGMYDVQGDETHGVRTIAVSLGVKNAALLGSGLVFLGILTTIPFIFLFWGKSYLAYIFPILDGLFVYFCIRLIQQPSPANAFQTKLNILRVLLLLIIALIVGIFIIP